MHQPPRIFSFLFRLRARPPFPSFPFLWPALRISCTSLFASAPSLRISCPPFPASFLFPLSSRSLLPFTTRTQGCPAPGPLPASLFSAILSSSARLNSTALFDVPISQRTANDEKSRVYFWKGLMFHTFLGNTTVVCEALIYTK